ncbi:MAG: hypothetical protein RJA99_4381 [Pseudomonadota bacterium]|jgi:hypothetical protein
MNESSMSLPGAATRAATRTRWFDRRGWQFGSSEFSTAALIVLLFVGLFPLASYVFTGFAAPTWPREWPLATAIWVAVVALGYPAWAALEARSFAAWARGLDPAQRAAETALFAARAAQGRLWWTGVLAAYLVVALLGFVVRG